MAVGCGYTAVPHHAPQSQLHTATRRSGLAEWPLLGLPPALPGSLQLPLQQGLHRGSHRA